MRAPDSNLAETRWWRPNKGSGPSAHVGSSTSRPLCAAKSPSGLKFCRSDSLTCGSASRAVAQPSSSVCSPKQHWAFAICRSARLASCNWWHSPCTRRPSPALWRWENHDPRKNPHGFVLFGCFDRTLDRDLFTLDGSRRRVDAAHDRARSIRPGARGGRMRQRPRRRRFRRTSPRPTTPRSRAGPIPRAGPPASGRHRPATARATFRTTLTMRDLYDADRTQPVLDQHGLGAGHRLPGHVHAGRLHVRRDRAVPREERRAHHGDELHDLPARLPRLLGLRLRARLGQLVERPGAAGLVRVARARAYRCSTTAGASAPRSTPRARSRACSSTGSSGSRASS